MEDNIKIFDECLKGTYQNEKLKPIINHLYEIVKKLESAIIENCKKEYNFNLYKMLLYYRKYFEIIFKEMPFNYFKHPFHILGDKIIAYYHLYDYNVDDLDNLFFDIIMYPDKYMSYLELNGVNDEVHPLNKMGFESTIAHNIVRNRFINHKTIK